MLRWLSFVGLITVCFASPPITAGEKDKPVRVLLVLNGHDYAPKAPILEKLLHKIGGMEVTRLEAKGDALKKLGELSRDDYDVPVCYGGPQANEVQERGLEK